MSVKINGKTIKDMPVTVAVIPPYTSLRLKRKIVGSVLFPYAISIAENGDVFIGGHNDHHVHHFDRNGRKLNSWRTPGNSINAVLVHGDYVYVAQCAPPRAYNYSLSGVLHGQILGTSGCYNGLTIGPDGRLYVPSKDNFVYIFNLADLSLFHKFGFTDPRIVRFDRDGNLNFGTWSSPAIRVYTPSGVLVRTYTPPSSTGTAGLFIDRAGNRLVGDLVTHRNLSSQTRTTT